MDFGKAVGAVPIFDSAGDVKFGGAVHPEIHLPSLVHSSLDVRGYGFNAENMTVIIDIRRLYIFRVIERACLLVTQQGGLHLWRQRLAEAVRLRNPQGDAAGAAGEHETHKSRRLREGIFERE